MNNISEINNKRKMQLIKIKFLNFRRFRKQEINLKEGLTIVFWENWAGKSTIIDGIWFCLFGASNKDFSRWTTSDFKSYFLKDREASKIELEFVFGWKNYRIVRIIDAGIKKYDDDFIEEKKDTLIATWWVNIVWWKEITDFLVKLFWVWRDIFLKSVFTKQKDLWVLSGDSKDRKKLINSILWINKIEGIIADYRSQDFQKKAEIKYIREKLENFDLEKIKEELKQIKKENSEILKQEKQKEKILKKSEKDFLEIEKKYKKEEKIKNIFDLNTKNLELEKNNYKNIEEQIKKIKLDLEDLWKKQKYFEEKKVIFEEEKKISEKLETLKKDEILFKQKLDLEKNKVDLEWKLKEIIKEKEKITIPSLNSSPLAKGKEATKRSNLEEIIKNLEENTNIIPSQPSLKSMGRSNLEEIIKSLEEKNKFLKEELQKKASLQKELQLIKKDADEKKEAIYDIRKIKDGECPTCKRKLWDYTEKFVETMNKDIEKLREKYWVFLKQKNDLVKSVETVEEEVKKIEKLKIKIEEIEKKLLRLKDLEKNEKNNLNLVVEKLEELKNIKFDKQNFEKIKKDFEEISINTKKLRIIEGEIKKIDFLKREKINLEKDEKENQKLQKDLEKNIEKLDFSQELFEKIKKDFEEKTWENLKISKEISKIKEIRLNAEKKSFELEKEIEKNKKLEIDLKKSLKVIEKINLKKQIFSAYSVYLLEKLKPNIEYLASSYFAIITNHKYSSISLDSEYRIKIDEKALGLYSWGEQDLANLCLRIALGQNLSITNSGNMINFLILDEVLWSQDNNRQNNILLALKKLETKFSQIILISHIDWLKDVWDNLLEVKNIDNLESEVLEK